MTVTTFANGGPVTGPVTTPISIGPDGYVLSLRQAHEIKTGCSRRLPCRDCDEEMRRLWYGDAYSDEDDE